jgi:preprotein translocase subunit YajC
MKIKKSDILPILGVIILFAFMIFLKYRQTFIASNWDKYYFYKMTWKEIWAYAANHKEPLISSIVILFFAICYVWFRDRKKNKNEPKCNKTIETDRE